MPTVLRAGPYRFFFYANEGAEPLHVHVQRDRALAKFWIRPVALVQSVGFASHELTALSKLVAKHEAQIEEAWNGFHDR